MDSTTKTSKKEEGPRTNNSTDILPRLLEELVLEGISAMFSTMGRVVHQTLEIKRIDGKPRKTPDM